jgi:hypothetical protein
MGKHMPGPEGWDINPSGGLAVNPSTRWDLIGTTDGMNAVLRLELASEHKEREAIQIIIATPAFHELAETFVRFADNLKEAIATGKFKRPTN